MKILIVTGNYAPEAGGIGELVRGLAGGLVANRVSVQVLAGTSGAAGFSTRELPVSEFMLPKSGYLKRISACRKAILEIESQFKFDRVIASTWSPFVVHCPPINSAFTFPIDILCHGMDLLEPRRSFRYRFLMRRTLASSSLVVAISRFSADLASSLGARSERLMVLNPGIDPNRFVPGPRNDTLLSKLRIESDALVLLSVGRLVERKGFDKVLETFPYVLREYPSSVYLVVGEGPDRPRLEQIAASLGITASVRFAGLLDETDLPDYYRCGDIFLMPNREITKNGDVEGFGIVFLEAGCTELPVIGGKSGGTADAVVDGETGFLVAPESTDEIRQRIHQLLANQTLRRKMGRAGRERIIRHFQWPDLARRYLDAVSPRKNR